MLLESEFHHGSSYHLSGSAVLVAVIEVALAVVGLHQAPQPAVQGQVGDVVRGKHQQVVGLLPPADLVLLTQDRPLHMLLTTG